MDIIYSETLKIKKAIKYHCHNTRLFSYVRINAIFTKSTVNICYILLSNSGDYQENRPIQRRDMDCVILPLEYSFVRKLSEGGVHNIYTIK